MGRGRGSRPPGPAGGCPELGGVDRVSVSKAFKRLMSNSQEVNLGENGAKALPEELPSLVLLYQREFYHLDLHSQMSVAICSHHQPTSSWPPPDHHVKCIHLKQGPTFHSKK